MDTLDTPVWIAIAVILLLAVLAAAAWFAWRRKQSAGLQQRFGPEYGRAVHDLGSKAKAESELKARRARVDALRIVVLTPAETTRFRQAWAAVQARFVDNPQGVVMQADALVRELMTARGYPVADFEQRAGDISVDHPLVVSHYRAAQAIALRDRRGEANTEDQRQAVVHYRALFDELLEVAPPARAPVGVVPQMQARA